MLLWIILRDKTQAVGEDESDCLDKYRYSVSSFPSVSLVSPSFSYLYLLLELEQLLSLNMSPF